MLFGSIAINIINQKHIYNMKYHVWWSGPSREDTHSVQITVKGLTVVVHTSAKGFIGIRSDEWTIYILCKRVSLWSVIATTGLLWKGGCCFDDEGPHRGIVVLFSPSRRPYRRSSPPPRPKHACALLPRRPGRTPGMGSSAGKNENWSTAPVIILKSNTFGL